MSPPTDHVSSSTPLRYSSAPSLKARVRSHPGILNENQRVGLRYYEEFQERIPRSEVRKIEERVREVSSPPFSRPSSLLSSAIPSIRLLQ